MGDKYLEEFDEIVGKKKWSQGMYAYRRERDLVKKGDRSGKSSDERLEHKYAGYEKRAADKARADGLISKVGSVQDLKDAIIIYSKIDVLSKPSVRKKIINFTKEYYPAMGSPKDWREVRDYLEKSTEEASEKSSQRDLEGKTLAIIGSFGIIASLFLLSPAITGNAIGSMNNGASFSLSAVLFGLGLVGLFVSFRRR